MQHCDKIGLGYSCSVWDTTSAREIVSLNPDLIKVGSPSNTHWEMQKVRITPTPVGGFTTLLMPVYSDAA